MKFRKIGSGSIQWRQKIENNGIFQKHILSSQEIFYKKTTAAKIVKIEGTSAESGIE